MKKLFYFIILLGSVLRMNAQTVVDIIVGSPDLNTLETAVIAAQLDDDLSGPGPFTVFAPTDAAFAALPAGTLDALLLDPTGDLTTILLYHVVAGQALSTDLTDGQVISTLLGEDITVTINGIGVFINDAQVILADLTASNGVVHVIDAVLLPPAPIVGGCTAIEACNYNALATIEDGSCILVGSPCDDASAATDNDIVGADCVCMGVAIGCTNPDACNFNVAADFDDGTCYFIGDACDDGNASTSDDVYGADCGCVGITVSNTVVDIIVNSPVHTTLEAAVIAAGLAETLSGTGPFTVFAPTDAAFAALPAGVLDGLLADPTGALTQVLLFHAVSGVALSTDLADGMMITTIQGQDVTVTINVDGVFINDAQVIVADILADNGVVHVIDAVLLLPAPQLDGCTAMEACNYNAAATLDDGSCELPGFPCDDANASTVNDVLGADCVCAGQAGGCTNMMACNYDMDAQAEDGSCQFPGDNCDDNDASTINDVITADCGCAGVVSTNTVVDIIVNSPDHTTLEAAVVAAGLVGTLSGTGPFTVFAPTDAAFAALPAGTVEALLLDPTGLLTQILLYHVVSGTALSTSLTDGMVIPTLNGASVTVSIVDGNVIINDALVTVADIIADNGVVHVISAVLLPPAPQVDGCTAMEACNYNAAATIDDGSCELPGFPCDDANASTVNDVLGADCVCAGQAGGCTDMMACNYNMDAQVEDGSCQFPGNACDDGIAATTNDVIGMDCICAGILQTNTVVDIIVNSPNHNTLESAVIAAGLADDLSGTGPFTVFAPTDAAFAALPADLITALLADPTGLLADVLLYHVVGGLAYSADLTNGQVITTLLGQDITVTISGSGVMINNANVIFVDIAADNGVVHVIDAVLIPQSNPLPTTILDIIVNSPVHNTLEAAVLAAGLDGPLSGPGPLTVFAPTDDAFAALPAGVLDGLLADPSGALTQVLLYHAVTGVALSTDLADGMMITTIQGQDVTVTINANGVFINDAQVIVADIIADNGVVHVIDVVLVPQLNPVPTTVVDIIVNSPAHNTLEAAVIAAELADDLSGAGPFTVFAPTDAAFAALPMGVLDALLADPTGALAQVLLYHVVSGQALSSSLTNGQTITTLQGQDVVISITGGNVFVNDAQVVMADIMADNGVVHVIDAVLTPTTRVNEVSLSQVQLYPNPAAENITVTIPVMKGAVAYSIFNTTGQLIQSGSFNNTTSSISLDSLSQGVYQLKLNNGAAYETRTFVKK